MKSIFDQFIANSYNLLKDYPKKGRYFHKLAYGDNSPTVVHKKTNQLTYVIEGKGRVCLDGIEQEINKNMPILINAGTKHKFIASEEGLVLFHIHIPDEGRDNDRMIVEGEDYARYK